MKCKSPLSLRDLFLTAAALAALAPTKSLATNLLGNADFETPDASGGDVPAAGSGSGTIGSGGDGDWVALAGNTFYTQTHALTGKQSGKMFGSIGLFQQTVPVAHDTDTFTAQVMMLNASNDPLKGTEGGFINMDFFDASGKMLTTVTGAEEGFRLTSNSPQDVWQLEKVTAPGIPGTAYVQVDLVAGPFATDVGGSPGGAVFVDDADFEETGGFPASWLATGNGSWANPANWAGNVIPQNITDSATFSSTNSTSPTTVSLDGNWTVGTLNLNSSNSYIIVPGTGGSLTLNNSNESANINITGNHAINTKVVLASPTNVNISNSGDSLTMAGSISGNALTKTGSGILTVGNLNVAGLSISSGTVDVAPGGSTANVTGSLSITSGSTLDLSNNDLIVTYTPGNSPASAIRGYLVSAYDGGAWDGAGLTSSAAHNDATRLTALGYADAGDVGLTSDDGVPITGNAVIIKYTYDGDSNLDGKVDLGNDFNLFLQGFLNGGSTWELGDYNYDGEVNLADFQLFIQGFKSQGGQLGELGDIIAGNPELTSAQKSELLAAVPEPDSIAILAAVPFIAVRRRRRH